MVTAVGARVRGVRVGDAVAGVGDGGAFAEEWCVHQGSVWRVPGAFAPHHLCPSGGRGGSCNSSILRWGCRTHVCTQHRPARTAAAPLPPCGSPCAAPTPPIPAPPQDGLDPQLAAALPIAYGTADLALRVRGRLEAGQTLLVLGASGGVGTAAVQVGGMSGPLRSRGSAPSLNAL